MLGLCFMKKRYCYRAVQCVGNPHTKHDNAGFEPAAVADVKYEDVVEFLRA